MVSFTRQELSIISEAKKILASKLKTTSYIIQSPESAMDYCRLQIGMNESEVFGLIMMNTKHQVIKHKNLFFGTIDGASVYPRQIVKECLKSNAAAVIIYHNHPSGSCEPSAADKLLTDRIRDALALIDVRVLDHFVVSAIDSFSFSANGLI